MKIKIIKIEKDDNKKFKIKNDFKILYEINFKIKNIFLQFIKK